MFEKNPYTGVQAVAGKMTNDAVVNREVKKPSGTALCLIHKRLPENILNDSMVVRIKKGFS
ncbi:MAG: hypothetical protein ABIO19_06550 [Burkholderiaceae bacterium]